VVARPEARFVIFHGSEDEVIPPQMGRALAAEHPQAVTFHEIPAAHHNDILSLVQSRIGHAMAELAPQKP
jgi:pimeloyl-ACP methyl ester carboxylesterase